MVQPNVIIREQHDSMRAGGTPPLASAVARFWGWLWASDAFLASLSEDALAERTLSKGQLAAHLRSEHDSSRAMSDLRERAAAFVERSARASRGRLESAITTTAIRRGESYEEAMNKTIELTDRDLERDFDLLGGQLAAGE